MAQSTKQVRVVSQATPTPNQGMEPTVFFDADGEPIELGGQAGDVAWGDVTGKPTTFPPASHTHAAGDVIGLAAVATSGSYGDLSDTPTIPSAPGDVGAAPATHTHAIEDVTGLQAVIDDLTTRVEALEGD